MALFILFIKNLNYFIKHNQLELHLQRVDYLKSFLNLFSSNFAYKIKLFLIIISNSDNLNK
jgi:hypothetical protein